VVSHEKWHNNVTEGEMRYRIGKRAICRCWAHMWAFASWGSVIRSHLIIWAMSQWMFCYDRLHHVNRECSISNFRFISPPRGIMWWKPKSGTSEICFSGTHWVTSVIPSTAPTKDRHCVSTASSRTWTSPRRNAFYYKNVLWNVSIYDDCTMNAYFICSYRKNHDDHAWGSARLVDSIYLHGCLRTISIAIFIVWGYSQMCDARFLNVHHSIDS